MITFIVICFVVAAVFWVLCATSVSISIHEDQCEFERMVIERQRIQEKISQIR